MTRTILLTAILCLFIAGCAEKKSKPNDLSVNPQKLSPAEVGTARAETDIAAGKLQILYYAYALDSERYYM